MSDRIGQQIGHYRLVSILGHGGFADVYLGEHVYLGTRAAIKILDTRLASEEIEHFQQEARIIAQLEHPHIVRILDFGVEEHVPFLVMSYAPNGSLRQHYKSGSKLPLATVVAFIKQIANALQYAHDNKLIHRDIKPENLLLGRQHDILLSDFGLAVVAQSSSQHPIRDVSGTIAYMAPEQARGKPQPASDQYALAIIAYEWLSGQRPFNGTYEEVIVQHAFTRPPSLNKEQTEITPAVEAVIMRALEKDSRLRFSSIQDFARTLEETYLADQGIIQPTWSSASYPPETSPVLETKPLDIASPSRCVPARGMEEHATINDVIYALAWSPDKHKIAYGSRERTIQIRGATTGECILTYKGHMGSVTTLAWSPDGQFIASASLDLSIHVWDTRTGQHKAIYNGHHGIVSALVWSPDSQWIASTSNGTDNTVHIWQATTGQQQLIYHGHTQWVRALAWSPNGKVLASGARHEIHIWDSGQGRRLFLYRGHPSWIRAIDWSSNGTRIASAGEDNIVHIWEPLNKGHLLCEYRGHNDWVGTVLWSPDGNWIASASKDHKVHVWHACTASNNGAGNSNGNGNQVGIYPVHTASAFAITWLSDSKHIVSANGNGSVQVWNIKTE
ncbi:serine/threonine-protein kinase [Dictyobacter arantiisoli]|uniref:Protein kinase domain-containing protein n=1 Tax=Dictyobacter arantiisoli TaxID=2014874 RepID=A0A5A5TD40_9CHLR|nr:serine/threonine-protein kinase [Dictyobacter arantiisoli]GCF09086.1 hypothetical protein KDI_26500 [Dictyobacter arantiisoli]